jgi:hypothetical protein
MKSVFTISCVAAVLGIGLGAVLAYVEVPATLEHPTILEMAKSAAVDTPAQSPPKAEVPETVFEFGNIEQGTSMSHVFKIRNLGQLPLRVEVKSTTCKCTVGDLSKNEVGPNEETVPCSAPTIPLKVALT